MRTYMAASQYLIGMVDDKWAGNILATQIIISHNLPGGNLDNKLNELVVLHVSWL